MLLTARGPTLDCCISLNLRSLISVQDYSFEQQGTFCDPLALGKHAARDLMRSQPRILQPLLVGQVSKRFHPKGSKEGLGGDKGVGRATTGFARASADHVAIGQPPDKIAADLTPEDVLQPIATDWLVVGNRGQHGEVEVGKVQRLPAYVCGGPDRGSIGWLGAQLSW